MCFICETLGIVCDECIEDARNQRTYAEELREERRRDDIADRHDLGLLERMLEV